MCTSIHCSKKPSAKRFENYQRIQYVCDSDQFYFYDVSLHLQETKMKVSSHQWSISPEHPTTLIHSKTSYVQMFELFRECARFGCFFIYYILLCGEVYWHYIISCYFFLIKCNSIQFYSTPWFMAIESVLWWIFIAKWQSSSCRFLICKICGISIWYCT